MWQNWQHIISEEAKKYGYGEDRILRESKIKAAAEAWFNSLPKECLAELKQRVGKAIAAANTKNVPLLPTDLMNIQLILVWHKVKPLLGSMQASMTAVETMMQPDRMESVEVDGDTINEGFRPEDYGYRVDEDSMRKDGKTFVIYKLSYSGGSIRFMDGRMGTVISRFATVREALAETKRLAKKDYPDAQIESIEAQGDTIAEGRDYYAIEGTVDNQAGGATSAPTMQEAEHYAKAMLAYLKKQSPKAKKITVHIFKVVNYERKDTPEKVLTVAEGIGDDINEAKKKLTSDQKAALKAYKLSCDMRDRDDITPDAYRHYEKRAKADAETCKKLGLGKEDGVYESVHEDSTQVIEGRIKQHDSVYFDSYTTALAAARAKAEKKGYEIDEEDWASQITHGYPGRPSVGKTTNKKINLTKNGKPVKPRLIISVYGMKNQFELTSYIS